MGILPRLRFKRDNLFGDEAARALLQLDLDGSETEVHRFSLRRHASSAVEMHTRDDGGNAEVGLHMFASLI